MSYTYTVTDITRSVSYTITLEIVEPYETAVTVTTPPCLRWPDMPRWMRRGEKERGCPTLRETTQDKRRAQKESTFPASAGRLRGMPYLLREVKS